jgi:predicted MFS family arabinose efflux permease
MTWPKTLSRDYVLSFFAQFTFSSVFCILIPAIPIYLHRFGAKEGEIGFLIGIFSVSSLFLRPFVGKALLSVPERNFMIAGTVIYILSCLAYLVAPPFWPLLIVRAIHGVGMAFFATASFTLLANMTPEPHRGRLISYFYLSFNLAFALGPYLGMLLINRFNFSVLFLACAGLSLGSFFLTWKLTKRDPLPAGKEPFRLQSFLSPGAIPPAIIAFMLNVIWASIAAFFPLYALKHGVENPGIFFVFLAITLLLGRSLGGRILDIYDRKKVILFCLGVIIVGLIAFPLADSLGMFVLVAVMLGAGWAFLYPILTIHVIENAGLERGPAMGTFTAISDLGSGLGPMVMGLVLEKTGYPIMFGCLTFTAVINLVYFYWAIVRKAKLVAPS